MKVSYNWLKEYLNFSVEPEQLAHILTSTGLEVENIVKLFGPFEHLVVGEVVECFSHPNADKLKITKVNIGNEVKQIICGASNIKKGQFVVVVLVGNSLVNQKGESFKIKKTKIRGEWSEGMICSEDEIGLGDNRKGILELAFDCLPGDMVRDYFEIKKDYLLEIGLTPNRTDAFGHIGVCKDIYAYFKHRGKSLNLSLPKVSKYRHSLSNLVISLDVENDVLCPQYFGVSIQNVQVGPSPRWLQNKLISIGLNPINNIVDITNFILYETGNPLHVFDHDKISNSSIIVRNAKKNEKFETLDSKKINLNVDDLVICDNNAVLCLAGVIGGLNECARY